MMEATTWMVSLMKLNTEKTTRLAVHVRGTLSLYVSVRRKHVSEHSLFYF